MLISVFVRVFPSENSLASVWVLKPVTVGVLLVWNKIYQSVTFI